MLRPLLIMALACQCYFFLTTVMRMRALLLEARQRTLAYRRNTTRPRPTATMMTDGMTGGTTGGTTGGSGA
jgi:hypothetical protein